MKFKVGDNVKIVNGLETVLVPGTTGKVKHINKAINYPYCVDIGDGINHWLREDTLELVETKENDAGGSSPIKDSGDRTQFSTGAVRDMQGEDKGRCDLLPLDVVAKFAATKEAKEIFLHINRFMTTGNVDFLCEAVKSFCDGREWSLAECMLEVSILYRDGAVKYQPNNWKLGIPISSYISSGVRHLIKYMDERTDERHDRSFVWNMLGAIWTMEHKQGTGMIDIVFSETGVEEQHENER